jgi:hypothetical protein
VSLPEGGGSRPWESHGESARGETNRFTRPAVDCHLLTLLTYCAVCSICALLHFLHAAPFILSSLIFALYFRFSFTTLRRRRNCKAQKHRITILLPDYSPDPNPRPRPPPPAKPEEANWYEQHPESRAPMSTVFEFFLTRSAHFASLRLCARPFPSVLRVLRFSVPSVLIPCPILFRSPSRTLGPVREAFPTFNFRLSTVGARSLSPRPLCLCGEIFRLFSPVRSLPLPTSSVHHTTSNLQPFQADVQHPLPQPTCFQIDVQLVGEGGGVQQQSFCVQYITRVNHA